MSIKSKKSRKSAGAKAAKKNVKNAKKRANRNIRNDNKKKIIVHKKKTEQSKFNTFMESLMAGREGAGSPEWGVTDTVK
jgi:hypothetical protein